jgi:hypothetical protein
MRKSLHSHGLHHLADGFDIGMAVYPDFYRKGLTHFTKNVTHKFSFATNTVYFLRLLICHTLPFSEPVISA